MSATRAISFLLILSACLAVVQAQCGDGDYEPNRGEACDDGNRNNNDGCLNNCTITYGWYCNVTRGRSVCATSCGDNITAGLEECDDGNALQTDGCNTTCHIVPIIDDDSDPADTKKEGGGGSAGAAAAGVIVTLLVLVAIGAIGLFVLKKKKPETFNKLIGKGNKNKGWLHTSTSETSLANNPSSSSSSSSPSPVMTPSSSVAQTSDISLHTTPPAVESGSYPQAYTAPPTSNNSNINNPHASDTSFMQDSYVASAPASRIGQIDIAANIPETAMYGTKTTATYNPGQSVRMFGLPIDQVRKSPDGVPVIVEDTIAFLEASPYAVREEGILRLAGNSQEIRQLRETYEKGGSPDFGSVTDMHSVGALLKQYLRELPKPLLLLTTGLKQVENLSDENAQIERLRYELLQNGVPDTNYQTLKRLFGFLNVLANNAHVNKMTPSNLCVVLKPTLKLGEEVLINLIVHFPKIFTD